MIAPGTAFGPYQILAAIGAGGMGEVYRARDERLGREVAIKVLAPAVAHDPERLARFEREAKLLASLSHPNIATLHEFGHAGTQHFLVMELAAGEDLATRIDRGAVPLDEALPLALQIAHALEAAHDKGIVHRDLKPANIKLAPDGGVKVLDFGLAKALSSDDPSSASTMNSPTLTASPTLAGTLLGTAAYMSPEQARGRAVDKRADIWAFGVVLFEMLAGARLFPGDTVSDTLAAVLRQEIDWNALPGDLPPALRQVLRRCLERDQKNRLHDVADARIVLDEIARGVSDPASAPQSPPPSAGISRRAAALLAAGTLAAGGFAGWIVSAGNEATTDASVVRLAVVGPSGTNSIGPTAVAPDGSFIVFSISEGTRSGLYLRRLDETQVRRLDRTDGAESPFVSADSRWIGFIRRNGLEKIAVDGGDPLPINANIRPGPGAIWRADGSLIVPLTWISGLVAVPPDGGAPRVLTSPDAAKNERSHWYPAPLPDSRYILFTVMRRGIGMNDADVAVLDTATGTYQTLFPGAAARFVPPGFLVFHRAGGYQVTRFDPQTRTVSGDSVRLSDDIRPISPDGEASWLAVGASGTAAFPAGPGTAEARLTWIAPGGALSPVSTPPRQWVDANLAPGGRRALASAIEAGRYVVHLIDFDRETDDAQDLPGSNFRPFWHPDGHRIAVLSIRKNDYDVYLKDLATSAPPVALLVSDADEQPMAWMPNGKELLVERSGSEGQYPLHRVAIDTPEQLGPAILGSQSHVAVSADGRWLAYVTDPSGSNQAFVRPLHADGVPIRVSSDGAQAIAWSPNKKELYYARPPEILAVTYRESGGKFVVEGERVWARVPGIDPGNIFEVGADGRILVDLPTSPVPPPELRVILGWARELAQKVK